MTGRQCDRVAPAVAALSSIFFLYITELRARWRGAAAKAMASRMRSAANQKKKTRLLTMSTQHRAANDCALPTSNGT